MPVRRLGAGTCERAYSGYEIAPPTPPQRQSPRNAFLPSELGRSVTVWRGQRILVKLFYT
jgi:hypothetical protein